MQGVFFGFGCAEYTHGYELTESVFLIPSLLFLGQVKSSYLICF